MNSRRPQKSLLPTSDREPQRDRTPSPRARRPRAPKTTASPAALFPDFLAAAMTLPPEFLADFE
jgi:hypothetical protein